MEQPSEIIYITQKYVWELFWRTLLASIKHAVPVTYLENTK